ADDKSAACLDVIEPVGGSGQSCRQRGNRNSSSGLRPTFHDPRLPSRTGFGASQGRLRAFRTAAPGGKTMSCWLPANKPQLSWSGRQLGFSNDQEAAAATLQVTDLEVLAQPRQPP